MEKYNKYKTTHTKVLLASFMVLLLNSCMVGPKFQKSNVEIPEAFRTEIFPIDSSRIADYHIYFNDSTLLALIDTALQNNPDALIAVSRVNEAKAYLGMAKADRLPSFGYGGNTAYGNTLGTFPTGQRAGTWFSATANINWELDFWGKFRRATEAAQADMLASEYGLQATKLSLIAQVANSYYSLLDYKKRLIIAERTLATRTKFLNIIRQRYDKGIVPEIDLNQAQIQEAYAATTVPVYKRSIAFAENALSTLVGKKPQEIPTFNTIDALNVPENIPLAMPSLLLTRRPDVLQAEQQLAAQNARIGVAQAMRFPSISLTGLLGMASSDLSAFNASDAMMGAVGGGLLGPIFQFGKNKRRVEAESEKTEQMRQNYKKVVLYAFRETEDALINIQTIKEEVSFVKKQLDASANAARLSRQRYDGGISSYLEVLDAERTLFEIELYNSELQFRHLSAYTDLYKALGGSW